MLPSPGTSHSQMPFHIPLTAAAKLESVTADISRPGGSSSELVRQYKQDRAPKAGDSGACSREILKFSFSKMHIWRILRKYYRKNEPKLTVKIACV